MNIAMFTNTYLPHVGGVARSVSTFAADLQELGHKVMIVAPTFEGQRTGHNEQNVVRVAAVQNFNGSDFSVRIPIPGIIEEEIKNFRPDIIHSHHPFLLGDAALRTAKRFDLPIIFTHHTLYEQYTHYVPFDSETMKNFVIQLATEYANLCNSVIAPSGSIKTLLQERGVKCPVQVLPTGIDLEFFEQGNGGAFRKNYNIPADLRVIGHIGRLAREKNLPYLASAVSKFINERAGFIFVVAGTGDAEDDIENKFAAEGLSKRLVRPGILKDHALADCYKAMDLFVFASQSETQGLVLMEAMAAGVPVIALSASGVDDVVEDGINGRILPEDCAVQEFADSVDQAFTSGELGKWRDATIKTAQRFSRHHCAEKLLHLYQEAVSKGSRHAHQEDILETISKKLKVEWELLREKASALKEGFSTPADQKPDLRT